MTGRQLGPCAWGWAEAFPWRTARSQASASAKTILCGCGWPARSWGVQLAVTRHAISCYHDVQLSCNRGVTMSKRHAIWIADEALWAALRHAAIDHRSTVGAVATERLKRSLDVTGTTGGKATVERVTVAERVPRHLTPHVVPPEALPPPDHWHDDHPLPPQADPVCRRCQHPKAKHWVKGCIAGCLCNEA